jgi:carboxymethylenebutenolidase
LIIKSDITIPVGAATMPAYLARPGAGENHPAVIVLEGVYGFDDELRRITELLASFGYVGLAIDYFHRSPDHMSEAFTPEGRALGEKAAESVSKESARTDVAAARDWLNEQPFVDHSKIGTWGFGFGGTTAFVTATLPGIRAATVFYAQSIASLLPSKEHAPLEDAKDIRAPLLLVFGGRDQYVAPRDVETIESTLAANNKRFTIQTYPNVGHSFFRATGNTASAREASDAWELVQVFFEKYLR